MSENVAVAPGPLRPTPPELGPARIDRRVDATRPRPSIDLVVPVFNEQRPLGPCIERLVGHLDALERSWRITVADNASTDGTWEVAVDLARTVPQVRALHLPERGRGRALRAAWTDTDAEVCAYTDVDLSTDPKAIGPLVASVLSGRCDLAIGSRLAPGSHVQRGLRREVISRAYNAIVRATSPATFTDVQCGFKAGRTSVLAELLPTVANDNWFFDTELLLAAQQRGYRVHEVPVRWVEDPDSSVNVLATAIEDLRGLARLARRRSGGRGR